MTITAMFKSFFRERSAFMERARRRRVPRSVRVPTTEPYRSIAILEDKRLWIDAHACPVRRPTDDGDEIGVVTRTDPLTVVLTPMFVMLPDAKVERFRSVAGICRAGWRVMEHKHE